MVMTSDSESVGCEFKYSNFCFWREKSSLISLILSDFVYFPNLNSLYNNKLEKKL